MPRAKRTRRGGQRRWGGYLLAFLLGAIATFSVYTLITKEEGPPVKQEGGLFEPPSQTPPSASSSDQGPTPDTLPPPRDIGPHVTSPGPHARIAIVIDDLGRERAVSRELLQWNLPVTLSILPFEPHSRALAVEAHQKGKEVILHLPMEPHGYPKTRPGEGALLLGMNDGVLLHQLSRDIDAVPYIKGVSNHMGSRFMEDSKKMKLVLSELKRRGLFFLDSRTTPETVGVQTANSIGLEAAERAVFLDNELNEDAIGRSLHRLIRLSLASGKAIGIGHPHGATIRALKRMIPEMRKKGIEVVSLSVIMEQEWRHDE
jgi:polysaccharide deacetylase 2 family uncharacterized protein YibQ